MNVMLGDSTYMKSSFQSYFSSMMSIVFYPTFFCFYIQTLLRVQLFFLIDVANITLLYRVSARKAKKCSNVSVLFVHKSRLNFVFARVVSPDNA